MVIVEVVLPSATIEVVDADTTEVTVDAAPGVKVIIRELIPVNPEVVNDNRYPLEVRPARLTPLKVTIPLELV
jgi:hypothetical protein